MTMEDAVNRKLEELDKKILEKHSLGNEDNWKHRSVNMRCKTCMWYVPKLTSLGPDGEPIGRCRKRAPTLQGWPVMYEHDWCGDHKIDADKLERAK